MIWTEDSCTAGLSRLSILVHPPSNGLAYHFKIVSRIGSGFSLVRVANKQQGGRYYKDFSARNLRHSVASLFVN
jgi:hypothetical protein